MPLFVADTNAFSSGVAGTWQDILRDLVIIAADPNLTENFVPRAFTISGTNVDAHQIFYVPPMGQVLDMGQTLVNFVANDLTAGPTLIIPDAGDADYPREGGNSLPLCRQPGVTLVRALPNGRINFVVYDKDGGLRSTALCRCNGRGYWISDDAGREQDLPGHAILAHELGHVLHFTTFDPMALLKQKEAFIVDHVDQPYRAARGLPPRSSGASVLNDSATGGCRQAPSMPVMTPQDHGTGGRRCIVAESHPSGRDSEVLNELRHLREAVLRRSPWGRALFERFHEHYYSFSTPIAERIAADAGMRESIGFLMAAPLINYLRIVAKSPRLDPAQLERCPPELRDFIRSIYDDLGTWLERIDVGERLAGLACEEAAIEIAIALRFRCRTEASRADYLHRLQEERIIPLRSNEQEAAAARAAMHALGATESELAYVLGIAETKKRSMMEPEC